MTLLDLARRSFRYYSRSNAAAIAGAAIATAVLTGALLVGSSVRQSLSELATSRLGKTAKVLTSTSFFREALAQEEAGTPLVTIEAVVTRQSDNRRVSGVQVYGVDERFWTFHKIDDATPANREAALSPAVAAELDVKPGDQLLIRLEKPSSIPRESLHGRKEDSGKTIRVKAGRTLDRAHMGEFSLRPQQGATRAIFVRLSSLQKDLDRTGRVNAILFPEDSHPTLDKVTLDDLGIRLKNDGDVEAESGVISPALQEAVRKTNPSSPFLTYLVNRITAIATNRTVPYSLLTGATEPHIAVAPGKIVLNDWAARDLAVQPGAKLRLEYYVWDPQGALSTKTSDFELDRVIPTVNDRSLAPEYPGITNSESLQGWDPPFPMNLKLVRPIDEDYWKRYRTTPKGYISIGDARRLWSTRFGESTLLRFQAGSRAENATRLRSFIDPAKLGMMLVDIRSATASASKGSTDFGEYFLYFSFFLVGSALLLLVLFFQFGIEQRTSEIGMLRAVGFSAGTVRRLFLYEGGLVAALGSLLGVPIGIAYSAGILLGLRTIWKSAVGTSELTLHLAPGELAIGWAMGFVFAIVTILLTIRRLGSSSPRELLLGSRPQDFEATPSPVRRWIAILTAALGIVLAAAGGLGKIPATGAFFGAGAMLLIAALTAARIYLGRPSTALSGIASFGFRNASWRPLRSTLSIALVASASFLLLALESFRQRDPKEGTGGYSMIAESQIPIIYDLNTAQGREAMGLVSRRELESLKFTAFRLKPGDDASCLNLYEPRNPRVLGASPAFLAANRFKGLSLLQSSTRPDSGGVIPAIGDANSLQYVMHKKIGDIVELPGGARLRIVGALENSLLQSELIISEADFLRAFPDQQGFRFFLIDGPQGAIGPLEDVMSDFGFDATGASERLASYHQVENTYLSTFQALGALGLLLGTAGLSAVLLRNVIERRKELALLVAVGYRQKDLERMVVAENALLALSGLVIGLGAAGIAVLPVLIERGKILPGFSLVGLILAVPLVAVSASIVALRVLRKIPLLESLRSS